jgi:hypothetical protein
MFAGTGLPVFKDQNDNFTKKEVDMFIKPMDYIEECKESAIVNRNNYINDNYRNKNIENLQLDDHSSFPKIEVK